MYDESDSSEALVMPKKKENKKAVKKTHNHDGHRERLRNKFLKDKFNNLEDHEALELLLFYCIPRQNTNDLAHKLINEFGTLHNLLEADPREISRICKLKINTAVLITLILPMYKKYSVSKWKKNVKIDSSKKACEFARELFVDETEEVFYMICLDSKSKVLYPVEIARGTIDKTPIYPRIIVEKALNHNAANVILAHNHPSGIITPSRADIDSTAKIKSFLATIEVSVIDHVIVGGENLFSFAEKKLLGLSFNNYSLNITDNPDF